jgi:hypothetical protein
VVRNTDGKDIDRNERWRVAGNERLAGDLKHLAPPDERHAACVVRLEPGAYSAFLETLSGQPASGSIELFVIQ